MGTFYVIRYALDVDLGVRKHEQTLGRFETWAEADEARATRDHANLLEAVGPRTERA